MKKLNGFLAGFSAIALLASCSNDEPANGGNGENKPEGELAYMTITIRQKAVTLHPAPLKTSIRLKTSASFSMTRMAIWFTQLPTLHPV